MNPIDWKQIAMLSLWDALVVKCGKHIEIYPDTCDLTEHEIALIENAYRDWHWEQHGKLINWRG